MVQDTDREVVDEHMERGEERLSDLQTHAAAY
jgi:hypothetical protein